MIQFCREQIGFTKLPLPVSTSAVVPQSSIFTALSGGGVKVVISLNAVDPVTNPGVVPMSHVPNWKLRKNPFWRLKQSQHLQQHQPQPTPPVNNPQLQPSTAGLYYGEVIPAPAPPAANVHMIFAYEASQPVEGVVSLILPPGKKAEHLGIKIQFIGRIEMGPQLIHEGKPHYDFISLSKELAPPGTLFQQETRIPFSFRSIEKEHESYRGRNVSVRYFVRVVVERKLFPPIQKEEDVWVQILGQEPTENEAIKMEVGIEGCLHIVSRRSLCLLVCSEISWSTSRISYAICFALLVRNSSMKGGRITYKIRSSERFISCWCALKSSTWNLP